MRTFKPAKMESARARRRRIDGTKTKKAVLVGAAVATAVSVGLTPPIANAVSSQTYVIGLPSWLPEELVGGIPTLPSDPEAINNAVVGVKDDNPLIGWGTGGVDVSGPVWQTWYNPDTMSFSSTQTGSTGGWFPVPLYSGGWTTTTWGQWVSPTDLASADPLAIVAYTLAGGDLTQALAPFANWTAYLQNVNLIAYGDGAVAAGQAYQAIVDSFNGETQAGYDPVTVGEAQTDPRQIIIVGPNGPIDLTTQSQTFTNVNGLQVLSYAANVPGIGHQVPMPDPTDLPGTTVIDGGVLDATLLALVLLRNPGRPGGGLYSQFSPIYEEVTGTNPVTPERQDVLPDGVDPELIAKILRGEPIDDISPEELLAAVESADGSPILITIKADATWEYDLLSDAPITANPVAWANSAVSSLLVFNLAGGLLELGTGGFDPDNPPLGVQAYVAPDGTIYATLTQSQLPLLAPARLPAQLLSLATGEDINTPISDTIEPLLKVLTNIAYTDVVRNVDPVTGEITYVRTHDEHHIHNLFGTQTLTRAQRAQLAGDLIAVLGAGIGAELTDIGWRTVGRVQELLTELDIEVPEEVSVALAKAIPAPGNLITKVSSELGAGVSDLLGEVERHLPDEVTLDQQQLEDLQRPVGQAIKPVKDVIDDVSAGLEQAAGQFTDGPATGDQEIAGVVEELKVAVDDETVDSKPVSKKRAQESLAKVRADLKEARDDVRADVKKATNKAKNAVKKAGDDIKKSVKDTAEKVKKAVTPKKAEKKADTSDSDD